MRYDFDDLYEGPRLQNRMRKRKIKLIISTIVAILSILILIVAINIFPSGSEETNVAIDENSDVVEDQLTSENGPVNGDGNNDLASMDDDKSTKNNDDSKKANNQSKNNTSSKQQMNNPKTSTQSNTSDIDDATKQEAGSDELVIGTIEKNWEPIGTTQQGDHVINYSQDSQDWLEMTEAVSVATGLPKDAMIVWWMGNGGGSNKVVSTVSSRDKQNYYRVQLEWTDNGWKPVLVEQLEDNDRKQEQDTTTSSTQTTETNN